MKNTQENKLGHTKDFSGEATCNDIMEALFNEELLANDIKLGIRPFEGKTGIYTATIVKETIAPNKKGNAMATLELCIDDMVIRSYNTFNDKFDAIKYDKILRTYGIQKRSDLEQLEIVVNVNYNDKLEFYSAQLMPK